ncbi:hypothetical protein FRB95_009779 [Tulasnella sp. JGI-2019a]|nr:hypothetical protein FRB95_009779 [Tulasnella sp. JGI-2019a]
MPESILANSIIWMLENSTEEEDILACADNIISLSDSSIQIISHSTHFSTLVQRCNTATTDAAHTIIAGSEPSALVLGRAVSHVLNTQSTDFAQNVLQALNINGRHLILSLLDPHELGHWELFFTNYVVLYGAASDRDRVEDRFMRRMRAVLPSSSPSTTSACLGLMKLSRYGIPFHAFSYIAKYRDPVVNLLCLEVIDLAEGVQRPLEERARDVSLAFNRKSTLEHIKKSVDAHDRLISKNVDRRTLLRYHTKLLRYFLSSRILSARTEEATRTFKTIMGHLPHVIVHCRSMQGDETTVCTGSLPMSAGDGESSETSFPKEDVDWEEKLSRDPLVKADTLQVELGAYVAQLPLTIGALPLDAKI